MKTWWINVRIAARRPLYLYPIRTQTLCLHRFMFCALGICTGTVRIYNIALAPYSRCTANPPHPLYWFARTWVAGPSKLAQRSHLLSDLYALMCLDA